MTARTMTYSASPPSRPLALVALPGGAHAVAFSQADTNRDGVVSWPEASRAFPRLRQVHFDSCDPNRDGVIEKNEYALLNNFYWMNYIRR